MRRALLVLLLCAAQCAAEDWLGTWASSPQLGDADNAPPAPGLEGATLRQIVRVSVGGQRIRLRFSNAFGSAPLALASVHVALSAGASAIRVETDRSVTFDGQESGTIAAGSLLLSDPLAFDLPPRADVAITLYLKAAPEHVTTHPGSRTTSFLRHGNSVAAPDMADAVQTDHWYFINGIDVAAPGAAIAVLGDSITDGRGSTTNKNDRWPDQLAERLRANKATAQVAVLNHGIGGNRLLRDGLGPNALARIDRDVLAQTGVRWLIVLEGINDIMARVNAAARGETAATAADVIGAYRQIVTRAHDHGIRVFGATIMPYRGFKDFTDDGEADRQAINKWIRTSGTFDEVIDFDAVTRDSDDASRLSVAFDSGDHLHPSAVGYRFMAEAVSLSLFER